MEMGRIDMMKATDAEISVVGGIIAFPQEAETTKIAYELLRPEMFGNEWMANTFSACMEIVREGKTPDVVLLEGKIGKENRHTLLRCAQFVPTLSGFKDYCSVVLEDWRRRTIQEKLQELTFTNPPAKIVMEQLEGILSEQRAIEQGLSDNTSIEFWGAVMRYMDSLMSPNTAVKTGWFAFDTYMGGLEKKGMYILSGRSGMGKTDFALAMALNISLRYRVSYFSMEMPVEQLMERVLSRLARVEANKLRDKSVSPEEMKRISDAVDARKNKTQIIIDEKQRMSVQELEAKILRQRPDVVFVDHVGLMKHADKRQLWEAVSDTSQRLKELAMKHKIVIVALAQENRNGDQGKPRMGNLKGSDNLTNDADGILQMHVPEHADFISGDAWIDTEIHVTKNRHGGTGKLLFCWQPQYHDWRPTERNR